MKWKKLLLRFLLAAAVVLILWIGDLLLGNPISYGIVKVHSVRYLHRKYPDQPLQVERIYHDWYSGGGYDVTVISPVSRDTVFMLCYDRLGILRQDCYEMTVASGNATLSRLMEEYHAEVASALSDFLKPHDYRAGLSCVDVYSGQPVPLETGIDPAQLTLDGAYNVAELGSQYGYINLTIGVEKGSVTIETAAELLLQTRAALAQQGIGWKQMDLFMNEENGKNSDLFVGINGIREEDLDREDVLEHLTAMRDEQLEYWLGPKEE